MTTTEAINHLAGLDVRCRMLEAECDTLREELKAKERNELMAQPGAMATAVDRYLTQKYEFGSETTVWFIRKRVEKRLREEGKL